MYSKFNPGDVVRLKSGGPKMTIINRERDDTIFLKWKCRWYSTGLAGLEDGYKEELFSDKELELIREIKD